MDPELLSDRLRDAAVQLGVEVRESPSDSEGAVVRLKGKTVVFVPTGALPAKRVDILAKAIAPLDTKRAALVPDVRKAIQAARRELRKRSANQ